MKKSDLKKLLADMSLEEKVMQLVQIPGYEFEQDAAVTGLSDKKSSDKVKRLAGSTLGVWGADKAIALQKRYMENHPHHIPLLLMLDVIHGHKTVFPCPLGQGATFDPEVAKKGAEIQAKEASAEGVHVTFSPMADLVRDARWGRVVESTGEDKYLNGKMVSAMVEGYQGTSLKDKGHVASCIKHFAAYGGAEAGRDYNDVELSEHTLREQYLPAYKEGIKAGARLVMTSFNTLNGIPSSGNKWLMKDILRKEMKFKGVLISDWAAIAEMVNWGFAKDMKEASRLAMEAGVDIDMCTGCYGGNLQNLVKEGKVSEKLLDEAVMRVLELKNDLGLFEDPYRGASVEKSLEVCLCDEHRKVARDAVRKSLVLLENMGSALPLSSKKIAFIGPYADEKKIHSSWAISGEPDKNVTIKEAAKELLGAGDAELKFAKGSNMLLDKTDIGSGVFEADDDSNKELLEEALDIAKWAGEIVLCLGEDIGQSGESTSRVDIRIPAPQKALFDAVCNVTDRSKKKLITLIFNGRPLDLEDIPQKSDALLICWRPGTEGGHGILDVLTGAYSTSGKLPVSFPWSVGQEPLHYDHYNTGRPKPKEGQTIFSSRYLDCPNEARFPFGFGLGYSEFEVSAVKLSKKKLSKDEDFIEASVTVKNIGKVEATETLQLYIRDVAGSRVRPVKELKGFEKVTLSPGKSAKVSFRIDETMLRFFTINNKFESEEGKFVAFIGTDSKTNNSAEFELV